MLNIIITRRILPFEKEAGRIGFHGEQTIQNHKKESWGYRMVKRSLVVFLTFVMVLCLLPGCDRVPESPTPTLPALADTGSGTIADGYDVLGGTWQVGGVYYKKHLIDITDNDDLEKFYFTTYLFFHEDESFLYMDKVGNWRGEYTGKGDGAFILKTNSVSVYDLTENGLVERELDSSDPTSYLVTVLDDNTLQLDEFDPAMGNAAADSYTLVFVKGGQNSTYIQKNKTPLSGSSNAKDSSNNSPSDTPDASKNNSPQEPSSSGTTSGMQNALKSAKNYLSVMPFSYSGLVEQLEYEGYSPAEAAYAADNCGADWYEQAVKSAKQYLEVMSFSRSGLIDQLEYEGFTYDQAAYGVDKAY